MNFHQRKAERKEWYMKYVHGWKLVKCGACNGSGHYDHNGAPKCGMCSGTGKVREKPQKEASNG